MLLNQNLIKVLTVLKQRLLRFQIHQKEIVTVRSFIKHINKLVLSRVVDGAKLLAYGTSTSDTKCHIIVTARKYHLHFHTIMLSFRSKIHSIYMEIPFNLEITHKTRQNVM